MPKYYRVDANTVGKIVTARNSSLITTEEAYAALMLAFDDLREESREVPALDVPLGTMLRYNPIMDSSNSGWLPLILEEIIDPGESMVEIKGMGGGPLVNVKLRGHLCVFNGYRGETAGFDALFPFYSRPLILFGDARDFEVVEEEA